MSSKTKPRKPRSTKKSSSQVKPEKVKTTPSPPAPKLRPSSVSSGEVAPAYATVSSTGYTGNRYYATRARLSYHPPDKQFKGEAQAATVKVATAPPKPKRGTLPAGSKP